MKPMILNIMHDLSTEYRNAWYCRIDEFIELTSEGLHKNRE